MVQGSGVDRSLRVTVLDQTDAALVIAQVTITDARGVERTAAVDDRGVAVSINLAPGTYQVRATAESFRATTTPVTVRRGAEPHHASPRRRDDRADASSSRTRAPPIAATTASRRR